MTRQQLGGLLLILAAVLQSGWLSNLVPVLSPSTIPGTGFRVLMVEDSAERHKLPKEQQAALESTEVRAYLDSHCVKNDKGLPEWRLLDDDYSPSAIDQIDEPFKTAYRKAIVDSKGVRPWWLISNGPSSVMPTTETETLSILRKHGGQ